MEKYNFIDIFLFAGSFHGLFLAYAIFRARSKEGRAWIPLCLLILVFSTGIALNMVAHIFFSTNKMHSYIIILLFLLMGPLVYFYVSEVTGRNTSRFVFPHLLPFIISACIAAFLLTGIITYSGIFYIHIFTHGLVFLQWVMYCIWSYHALFLHARKASNLYSSLDRIKLSWLRFLVGCFVFAIPLSGIADFAKSYFGETPVWELYWLYVSLVVYAIGYRGLWQPDIWKDIPAETTLPKKKYEKTHIDSKKLTEIKLRLTHYVKTEKPYLDEELSMPSLAKTIGIPSHHLSQVINDSGENFYEFINRQRINHAKELISQSDDPISISRIAFDSGFNSLSAFNVAFKKFCGMTPSQWKDSARRQ